MLYTNVDDVDMFNFTSNLFQPNTLKLSNVYVLSNVLPLNMLFKWSSEKFHKIL